LIEIGAQAFQFHRVGQILDALDKLGVTENTMVIYTSDNGPENTWKERINVYGHRSSGVYRDGKRSRYEGGHRVPFLIRWPKKIAARSTCGIAVCQTDFLATFAEMLGKKLPTDAGEDSVSFYPVLTGGTIERAPIIHHSASGQFAIREGPWKLIVNAGSSGKRRKTGKSAKDASDQALRFELYNLESDPSESSNVVDAHADRAKAMAATLERIKAGPRSSN